MGAVHQEHRVTMLRGGVSRHHAFRVIPITQAADDEVRGSAVPAATSCDVSAAAPLLLPLAAVVAYSIVYLGMHHPSDVAFGATLELRWAWRPARGGGIFASRPRRLTCPR
jgi:hypothetical protein